MESYILSLLAGVLAGIIYSVIRVRSPAPPIVALVGLLGMVIGGQIIPIGHELISDTEIKTGGSKERQGSATTAAPKLVSFQSGSNAVPPHSSPKALPTRP